jgi:CHAT domain-containing protein
MMENQTMRSQKFGFLWRKRSLILFILLFVLSTILPALLPSGSVANPIQQVQQGKALYQSGKFTEAVPVWQQVASGFASQGDLINQAMALSNLSLVYQELEQWQEADRAIGASLEILKLQPQTQERERILAQTLDIQGRSQLATGKASQALEAWQQATSIHTQIGDKIGVMQSQINYAQALQSLGRYRQACRTLQDIFALPSKECEISETELEMLQVESDSLPKVLGMHGLGNILRLVGQLDPSEKLLTASLHIAESKYPKEVGAIQLSLANTNLAQAERAKELKEIEIRDRKISAAIALYQQAATDASSPIAQVQAQLNQFRLLLETAKPDRSNLIADLFSRLQTQIAVLPPSQPAIYARINLAQSLICLNAKDLTPAERALSSPIVQSCAIASNLNLPANISSPKTIEALLNTAIAQSQLLQDRRAQAYALGYLAGFHQLTKQYDSAEQLTKQALSLTTNFANPDIAYRWQWQLGRLSRATKMDAEAIRYYSSAFNTLQTLRRDLVAIAPEVQFSFRDSIEPIYREFVDLLLQDRHDKANLTQARDVIEALQLAELDNFFREACIDVKLKKLDDVDPTAAVFYPIILADRLDVIVKFPGVDELQYHTNHVPQANVETILEELRASLLDVRATAESRQRSQQVYEWIVRPVADRLARSKVKTLAFVLDGSLRNIPMAALYDGKQYLVEKYAIALTPGLQLLDPKPIANERLNALLAGISKEVPDPTVNFPALPNVESELQEIQTQLPAQKLLNQDFTRANLQKSLSVDNFTVVHLATHGQFSSNAEQTFILAWDRRLKVKDLNNLLRDSKPGRSPKNIDLLVLSACQTAAGDRRAALGLAGIAVRAGARSTLATLWQADDAFTAAFMQQFYQELNQPNMTRAEALRRSQQIFIAKNAPIYFWSPFVLVGNWL